VKKVLVLGGGFAGVEAAIFLQKEGFEVTLVSERNYFYNNPTSIWVPTHRIAFEKVCIPLEALQDVHGFALVIDRVVQIRSRTLEAELASGVVLRGYDYMVVAVGASKMRHPGIEHTLSICGVPEESLKLRERIDALVAKGEGRIAMGFGGNPKDTSAVRGGPGFELMFNVEHMLRKKGVRDRFELTMFAPMEEPGKRMGPQALKMMGLFFEKLGIKRRFGTRIREFDAEGVVFENGSRLDTDLTMFIPGGSGHEVVKGSDLPTSEAGFVTIDDHCRVVYPDGDGPDTVYAIGDVAALEGPQWRAKQGHIAEVMARNAAFNIAQHSRGSDIRKGYREHLNILCVMDSGDGAAFVFRDDRRAMMVPLPIVGHWIKRAWGLYFRWSKLGKIFRLPGM
jgi:sulfide:quinone oxidoreductase